MVAMTGPAPGGVPKPLHGQRMRKNSRVTSRSTLLTWLSLALLVFPATACTTREQPHPEDLRRLVAASPPPPSAKFRSIAPEERLEILGENGRMPYLIGVGDVLQITGDTDFLRGFGETTTGQIVGTRVKPDGNVYLPTLGAVPATGRTVVQLQDELRERLKKYKDNPFASVDVIEHRSQKFYVLGAVAQPGVYPVDASVTLLGSLGLAGGASKEADLEQAYVVRDSKILPVSLADMVKRGDMSRNVTMRNGDLVFVPPMEDAKVYVVGEVKDAGAIPMGRGRITLAGALAAAGGVDPATADQNAVRVFRGGWCDPECFTLSSCEVLAYGESIQLRSGDRVFVAPTEFATYSRAFELVNPFLNATLQSLIVALSVANLNY